MLTLPAFGQDEVMVDSLAQDSLVQDSAQNQVIVDYSDLGEYIRAGLKTMQLLKGHVELRQEDVYMYCDSASIIDNNVSAVGKIIIQQNDTVSVFADSLSYVGDKRIADLFGDVVLDNRDKKLFTNRLNYNLNTKVAQYFNGATLTNGDVQLTSKIGYYYVDTDMAYFKDSVVVVDPEFTLRSDTLKFNTKTQMTTFLGPTLISQNDARIYCEDGFYDTANNKASFKKNAQYVKEEQEATADTITYDGAKKEIRLEGNARFKERDKVATADIIRYDEVNEITYLEGNAHFRDSSQNIVADTIIYDQVNEVFRTNGRSVINDGAQALQADKVDFDSETGMGIASGDVIWQDTSSNITITCEQVEYDKDSDYIKATGGRPMLSSILDGDTMYMASDTLLSFKENPDDSLKTLVAYSDVRIFKSDLQAVCDSLAYSSVDSVFRFYRDPVIWSDSSQFTADSIVLLIANDKVDKINLYENSFIINTQDEVYYNQIKGKFITAFFVGNKVDNMEVDGNAESVYYATDDAKAYIGVNKTACSQMRLYFNDNEVETIKFFKEPKANLYPMKQINHNTLRLDGFQWKNTLRPVDVASLLAVAVEAPAADMENGEGEIEGDLPILEGEANPEGYIPDEIKKLLLENAEEGIEQTEGDSIPSDLPLEVRKMLLEKSGKSLNDIEENLPSIDSDILPEGEVLDELQNQLQENIDSLKNDLPIKVIEEQLKKIDDGGG